MALRCCIFRLIDLIDVEICHSAKARWLSLPINLLILDLNEVGILLEIGVTSQLHIVVSVSNHSVFLVCIYLYVPYFVDFSKFSFDINILLIIINIIICYLTFEIDICSKKDDECKAEEHN